MKKLSQLIFIFVVSLFFISPVCAFSGSGSGTKEDPYQITTAEQMNEVRNDLQASYILSNDIDLSIYQNWIPIGNEEKAFSGQFNGLDHKISNLKIIRSTDSYIGLFGMIKRNTLTNLKLENVQINLTFKDIKKANYSIGSIVGIGDGGSVLNCYTEGLINVNNCNVDLSGGNLATIGGLAAGGITMKNCINKCDINGVNFNAAGIAASGKCYDCINYGNIFIISEDKNRDTLTAGGINNDGDVYRCKNYGDISCRVNNHNGRSQSIVGNAKAGGIQGYNSANDIIDCINYGNISAIAKKGNDKQDWCTCVGIAGGITSEHNFSPKIKNCFNYGKSIIAKSEKIDKDGKLIEIKDYAYRICRPCSIENCYSLNSTTVNGEFPTEYLSATEANGASVSENELNNIVKGIYKSNENILSLDPTFNQTDINPNKDGTEFRLSLELDGFISLNDNYEFVLSNFTTGQGIYSWTENNGDLSAENSLIKLNLPSNLIPENDFLSLEIKDSSLKVDNIAFYGLNCSGQWVFKTGSRKEINQEPNQPSQPENPDKTNPLQSRGNEIIFGKDNFKFTNYGNEFINYWDDEKEKSISKSCLVTDQQLNYLKQVTYSSSDLKILNNFNDQEHYGGHCHGIATVAILNKIKAISGNGIPSDRNLYNLGIGSKTPEVRSLICAYQLSSELKHMDTLRKNFVKDYYNAAVSGDTVLFPNYTKGNQRAVKELVEKVSTVKNGSNPVLISITNGKGGDKNYTHAIVGYAYESGNFIGKNGDHYNGRILIYDCESGDTDKNQYNPDYNMLINLKDQPDDSTPDWEVSAYVERHDMIAKKGTKAKINCLQSSIDELDHYIIRDAKATSLKATDSISDIQVKANSAPFILKELSSGKQWSVNPSEITPELLSFSDINDGSSLDYYNNLILPKSTSAYEIYPQGKVNLIIENEDYYFDINGLFEQLRFDPKGTLEIKNADKDCLINPIIEDKTINNFLSYDITKINSNLTISLENNNLKLSGNSLKNLSVEGTNFENTDKVVLLDDVSNVTLDTVDNRLISKETDLFHEKVSSDPVNPDSPETQTKVPIYRLYNQTNAEHLYTSDANEASVLTASYGWTDEGIGWNAPASGSPVYRLYSPVTCNHLFTTDLNEKNILSTQGWQVDNSNQPLFYSGGNVTIYRLYHEGIRQHLLTKDSNEYNVLGGNGWNQEGVKLYALSDNEAVTPDKPFQPGTPNTSANVSVNGISINPTSMKLEVGQSQSITITVTPNNATNKDVTWTSSDLTTAEVLNGVVTAKKAGSTVITAKTVDGNFTATCLVYVTGRETDLPSNPQQPDEPSDSETNSDFLYHIEDNTAVIDKYNGSSTELIIPNKLEGYQVSKLGMYSFSEENSIQKVTVKGNISEIDIRAFEKCFSLKEINVGGQVKTIPYCGFLDCSSLETVRLGAGVETIGTYTFYNCPKLKEIYIPSTVKNIHFYSGLQEGRKDLVIYGTKGSKAEVLAREYNYQFIESPDLKDEDFK